MPNTDDQNLELLKEARDNLIIRIGQVSSEAKPDYDIDGQKVLWGTYLEQLRKALKDLTDQIAILEGPFEIESIGYC